MIIIIMNTQFYKFATSLNQKLVCHAQCFVKIGKSIRKYRKIFLSNLYFYVLSEDKVKFKTSILKITKIYISINSSEFVLMTDSKSVLIDQLSVRDIIKKEVANTNAEVQIVSVKQPLLDDYAQGIKQQEKEELLILNLNRMKADFQELDLGALKKTFDQLFKCEELIYKSQYATLITVCQQKSKDQKKKKKKGNQKQQPKKFTVKIYKKKFIGQNKILLDQILRERKYLQQALCPYIPTLYKCMHSKSGIYCITEYYKGQKLQKYIKNENMNKTNFRNLLAQIIIAIGQIHQCGFVYNNINLSGILITSVGYVMLNQFGYARAVDQKYQFAENDKLYRSPQTKQDCKASYSWDWWAIGQLIYQIKQARQWKEGVQISWSKEQPQLGALTLGLLQKEPIKRLGWKYEYHQILGHEYFKGLNKKQLATKNCEPLKKFFNVNNGKTDYQQDGQDWTIHDSYLKNYQFCRQLQD